MNQVNVEIVNVSFINVESTGDQGASSRRRRDEAAPLKLMEWPAPPFGVVGSPEAQIGGMDHAKDYLRARRRHR
jgi:hypothetical protein